MIHMGQVVNFTSWSIPLRNDIMRKIHKMKNIDLKFLDLQRPLWFFLFDRPRSLNPPIYKQLELGRFWRFLSPSKIEPNRPAEVCCQQFLQTRPAGLWLWPLPIGHHQCGADHLSAGRWRDWGPFGSQRFFQRGLHQGTERRGLKSHDRPAEESTVMKEFMFESG